MRNTHRRGMKSTANVASNETQSAADGIEMNQQVSRIHTGSGHVMYFERAVGTTAICCSPVPSNRHLSRCSCVHWSATLFLQLQPGLQVTVLQLFFLVAMYRP